MKKTKLPLILHIGAHKTGSTTIQNVLRSAEDNLRAAGILYPRAGCVGNSNHSMLAWAIRSDPRAGDTDHWQAVFDEAAAAQPDAILLSGEEFEFLNEREIEALHNRLADRFDVRIVYYVRRQDEIMVSEYLQWIKTGVTHAPFAEVAQSYFGHKRFQFAYLARLWQEAFGKDSVTIRSFSTGRLKDNNLLADFEQAIGLTLPLGDAADVSGQTLNVSPGLYTLLCGRFVEALDALLGAPIKRRDNYLEVLSGAMSQAEVKEPRFAGFSDDERQAFLASYAEDNRRLAEMFFGGREPFPPITPTGPEAEPDAFLNPSVFHMISTLALIAWKEPKPFPKYMRSLESAPSNLTTALKKQFGLERDESDQIARFLLSQVGASLTRLEQGRIPGLGVFKGNDMADGRKRVVMIIE